MRFISLSVFIMQRKASYVFQTCETGELSSGSSRSWEGFNELDSVNDPWRYPSEQWGESLLHVVRWRRSSAEIKISFINVKHSKQQKSRKRLLESDAVSSTTCWAQLVVPPVWYDKNTISNTNNENKLTVMHSKKELIVKMLRKMLNLILKLS